MLGNPEVFDREVTLYRFDGDEFLLRQILSCFLEDAPRQMALLRAALAAGECAEAQRIVHALGGAAAIVGAARVRNAASSIEEAARAHRRGEADSIFGALKYEVARFRDEIVRSGLVPKPHAAAEGELA